MCYCRRVDAGWAAIIGALGASSITGAIILARDALEARRRRVSEALAAAEAVLAHSMAVIQLANAFRLTMQIRSGLKEGLDVALRLRRPLEPFDISDRITAVFQPLFSAQAAVWSKCSRVVIPLVNEVVDRCVDLIGTATEGGRAGSAISRYALGERWTDEQERDYLAAVEAIGDSRRKLAHQLRIENRSKRTDDL